MPRTIRFIRATAVALACVCAVSRADAQSAGQQPTVQPTVVDSTRPRQLQGVTVRAEKAKVTREGVLWLMEENIRLARQLREEDRKVDQLEKRLAGLQVAAANRQRAIDSLDASAAETRARRQALEARLSALEANSASGNR